MLYIEYNNHRNLFTLSLHDALHSECFHHRCDANELEALAVGYKILSWCSTNDLKADWIKISLFFLHLFTLCRRKEDAMSASFGRHETWDPHVHTRSRLFRRDQPNSSWCWAQSIDRIDHRPWPRQSSAVLHAAQPLRQYWAHVGRSSSQRQRSQVRGSCSLQVVSIAVVSIAVYCGLYDLYGKKEEFEPNWAVENHSESLRQRL